MTARRVVLLLLVTVVGAVAPCREAGAGAELGGRFWLAYQQYQDPQEDRDYFVQHYEAVLRDQLFRQNNLRLTFYFDNSDNLTNDLTYRRYRGHVDLTHRYYTFGMRYAPRQKVSALELQPSLEAYRNQLSLDIHVPDTPRLRLTYDARTQYLDEARTVDIKDARANLDYRYRVVDMRAHRWHTESRSTNSLTTDVTGAGVNALKMFGPWVAASAGWDFSYTESDREIGPTTTTTNNTLTGSLSWRYRHVMNALASGSTRYLTTEHVAQTKNQYDNYNLVFSFLPTRHVRPEVSQTYIMTETNGARVTTNYASLQILADGEVWRRTWGRAQVTRRTDLDTQGGVLPNHIYLVAIRSTLYRGIDLRAELTSNESLYDSPVIEKFQNSSVLEFYLVPLQGTLITPYVRYLNRSDEITFRGNDQAVAGLTATYSPRFPRMSLGFDANRTELTTGLRRVDTAGSVNLSLYLRERSSFNASYGIRETDRFQGGNGIAEGLSRAKTLNLQGQVWLTRRGSLSIVYTGIDRDPERDTSQFSLTYRQDF